MLSKKEIELLLMDFLFFIEECHQKTSYADDRTIYATDAIMVISWIKKLNTEITIKEFYNYIDNRENTKSVFDGWRQGHLGELFASKFIKLKENLVKKNSKS